METAKTSDTHLTLFDRAVFDTFIEPGEVVEIRIPHAEGMLDGKHIRGTVSGYFDNFEAFREAVQKTDTYRHDGIYFTLQVIDPRLLARACNRLKQTNLTTADVNVLAYRWLPIDVDPVRPSGISSSNRELEEALAIRDTIAQWVTDNLQFPKPIKAMSGNGGHLLYRLPDLPATKHNETFIKNTLEGLAQRFNTDRVTIDTKVFNPARIWKIYGTTTHKGDAVPANEYREARPHRVAYIESLGDN